MTAAGAGVFRNLGIPRPPITHAAADSNLRVQGSSPCAPTNPFKHLAKSAASIPTGRSAVIPTD